MDLCDELENLAITATFEEPEQNAISCDPTQGTIRMWQERFGYTYEEAAERLQIISIAKKQSAVTRQETLLPAQARTIYALKLEVPCLVFLLWHSGQYPETAKSTFSPRR
jgi:hypothetical protein